MVVLRYADRLLWVRDLAAERDPNFMELCQSHADRMTAPVGWTRHDERVPRSVAVLGSARPERPAPSRHPRGTPLGGAEETGATAAPVAAAGRA